MFKPFHDVINLITHWILSSFTVFCDMVLSIFILSHCLTLNSLLEMIRSSFLRVWSSLCPHLLIIPLQNFPMFPLKSCHLDPVFVLKSPASTIKSLFGVLLIISFMVLYNCSLISGSFSEFFHVWEYIDINLSRVVFKAYISRADPVFYSLKLWFQIFPYEHSSTCFTLETVNKL